MLSPIIKGPLDQKAPQARALKLASILAMVLEMLRIKLTMV